MKPHLVKKIINSKTGEEEIVAKDPVDVIPLKKENVNFIKRAMQDVTQKGTGRAIFCRRSLYSRRQDGNCSGARH